MNLAQCDECIYRGTCEFLWACLKDQFSQIQRFPGEEWCHLLLKKQEVGQAKGMGQGWQLSSEETQCQKSWGKREHCMFKEQEMYLELQYKFSNKHLNYKHQPKEIFLKIQWLKILLLIFKGVQESDFSNLIMLFLWPPLTIFLCVSISSFIIQTYIHYTLCSVPIMWWWVKPKQFLPSGSLYVKLEWEWRSQ